MLTVWIWLIEGRPIPNWPAHTYNTTGSYLPPPFIPLNSRLYSRSPHASNPDLLPENYHVVMILALHNKQIDDLIIIKSNAQLNGYYATRD